MKRFSTSALLTATALVWTPALASAQDVQIQSQDGMLVLGIGEVDEAEGLAAVSLNVTLGQRVFTETLLPNFLSTNPGFNIEPTNSTLLPEGVEGLGDGVDVFVDFVPTTIDGVTSSFFFFDGSDTDGDGSLTFNDIDLAAPTTGQTFGLGTNSGFVSSGDGSEFVSGGLIETTSVPTQVGAITVAGGRLHEHLTLGVLDPNENINADQAPGLYVTSLQVRADGFEDSDPFFFVFRSPITGDAELDASLNEAQDLTAAFIEELLSPPTGDFNFDGLVNAADFVVLRDGVPEGDVGENFDLFALGFDASNAGAGGLATGGLATGLTGPNLPVLAFSAATVAVPEPCTALLAMAAVSLVAGERRRR